jgi:hypothetical protein
LITIHLENVNVCGQGVDYLVAMDRGTALIMKAFAVAVNNKGENTIHVRKEMEDKAENYPSFIEMIRSGHMTSNMTGNLSKARFHGLIARKEPGVYCITVKGARFIFGKRILRFKIESKSENHKSYYLIPKLSGYTPIENLFSQLDIADLDQINIDNSILKETGYSCTMNELLKLDEFWEITPNQLAYVRNLIN